MNSTHSITDRAVRDGREYITYSDGSLFTRRLDRTTGQPLTDWSPVEKPVETVLSSEPPPTRYLSVIAEHQAEDEPKHWSLSPTFLTPWARDRA